MDTPGEWRRIYNDITEELFVHHYDTQKGVGIKCNLTRGLIRDTRTSKIKQRKAMISRCGYYKHMFEVCDRFNFGLNDKSWPHKRGGKRHQGEYGRHHDVIMACIL